MKNINKTIAFLALPALAFVCCAKESDLPVAENGPAATHELCVNASADLTRTTFGPVVNGVYPVFWSESGESVRVYERVDGSSWGAKNISIQYIPQEGLKKAQFKINMVPQIAGVFDYYVVYPADGKTYQINQVDSPDNWLNTLRVSNADVQKPLPGGVDHKYTFLVGKQEGLNKQPSSIDVNFNHILAYAKMTVKNLAVASTDKVSDIKIYFNSRQYITGFVDYRIAEDQVLLTKSNSLSKNFIEINPDNLTTNEGDFDVWFALPPLTLAESESLSFIFTTSEGDVTKTISLSQPMEFKRGNALSFSIDMSGTSIPKKLKFDFSEPLNLPTATVAPGEGLRRYLNYPVIDKNSGKAYIFRNFGGTYHGSGKTYVTIYEEPSRPAGYLGFPAVPGYKLSKITVDRGEATGATVYLEIVGNPSDPAGSALTPKIEWLKGNASPSGIVLDKTKENTVYYLHSLDGKYVPVSGMELEYTVASKEDAHPADYDIFLFLGDDNMLGRGETLTKEDSYPEKGIYVFTTDNTVISGAQPLYNMQSTVRNAYTRMKFSLAGPFAKAVSEKTGHKVIIVCNARGNATIDKWHHGAEPLYYSEALGDEESLYGNEIPNLFDEAVARAKAAMSYGTLRAVLWHHGEHDASMASTYMESLAAFASELRSALGMTPAQLPFIIGELNYCDESAAVMNPVLKTVASKIDNSFCVSAEDCLSNNQSSYFSKDGLTIFGQRYADAYFELTK